MSDTMNAKKELLDLTGGEEIVGIELRVSTKKKYMTYEGTKVIHKIPRVFCGKTEITEALKLLDYDFDVHYNEPSGPNFTAWTKSWVIYCTQYSDGQSGYEKVERFPPAGLTEEEYMRQDAKELKERLESLDWYKKKKKKYDWTPEE